MLLRKLVASLLENLPVDTGRKLNVLCAFNLRPVSTGLLTSQKIKSSNIPERVVIRAGEGMMATSQERVTIRAGKSF